MIKLYRGTFLQEAKELLRDKSPMEITHWVESFDRALMYSQGAVIMLVFDSVPIDLKFYRQVCYGDRLHGTFMEYRIPRAYYENVLCNWFESDSTIIRQEEKENVFNYSRKKKLGSTKLRILESV